MGYCADGTYCSSTSCCSAYYSYGYTFYTCSCSSYSTTTTSTSSTSSSSSSSGAIGGTVGGIILIIVIIIIYCVCKHRRAAAELALEHAGNSNINQSYDNLNTGGNKGSDTIIITNQSPVQPAYGVQPVYPTYTPAVMPTPVYNQPQPVYNSAMYNNAYQQPPPQAPIIIAT